MNCPAFPDFCGRPPALVCGAAALLQFLLSRFLVLATLATLAGAPSAGADTVPPTSPGQPAGEPYGLTVTRIYHNSISLSWRDNTDNETGFNLLRSTTPAGATTLLAVPANTTSFSDNSVTANTLYYYRVQAVNGPINGDLSAQVSARSLSAASSPAAPSNLLTRDLTPDTVRLSWTDNSSNEDLFIVELSSNPVTSWTEIDRPLFNTTSTDIESLTPNTAYSVRVRSVNATGAANSLAINFRTPKVGGDFLGRGMRGGNLFYFAYSGPHRIERFDLTSRNWLPPLPMEAAATALWVDEAGIYAAEGQNVIRWALDGTGRSLLASVPNLPDQIVTTGNVMVVFSPFGKAVSLDKQSGSTLQIFDAASIRGISYDPISKRIYGRDSASDLQHLEFGPDGTVTGNIFRPNNLQLEPASRTYVFPGGSRVADNSGGVFSAGTLRYAARLGASFTDLAFYGNDIPIVLRGNTLVAYSNTFEETGRYMLGSGNGQFVAVDGRDAIAFLDDGTGANGMTVEIVPLSALDAPSPGLPLLASGASYPVDDAYLDRDGLVHLYSKGMAGLFRWSPAQRQYLPAVPLPHVPEAIAYSPAHHKVYTAYLDQSVRQLDLSSASSPEVPFANLPAAPLGLAAAGPYLYASAGERMLTFNAAGITLSGLDAFSRTSRVNTWDPVMGRMYHFPSVTSPSDLLYDRIGNNGLLAGTGDSPLNFDTNLTEPIRVSPDGALVLVGNGTLFRADGLTRAGGLTTAITDGVWKGATLITLRPISGATQLQTWSGPDFTSGNIVRLFPGDPVRLFNTASGLLVITSVAGAPRFTLLDTAFDPIFASPLKPLTPAALAVAHRTADAVSLQWSDSSDNEDGFRIDYRPSGSSDPWKLGAERPAGSTTGTVTGLPSATTFEFRVLAMNAGLFSPATPSVQATTLTSPDQPAGEPYFLTVSRLYHNSVTLTWQDNATNETGFLLFRASTPTGPYTAISLPANTTSYTETGLLPSTARYYRIQAVNGANEGDLSAPTGITTLPAASSPTAAYGLSLTDLTPNSVKIFWQDNSTNEDQFILERAISPFTSWTEVARTGFNVTTLAVNGLQANTAYLFRVRAFNATGSNSSTSLNVVTPKVGGDFLGISRQSGGIFYFAFDSPNRLERYHLANRSWLTPLSMEAPATALWVDESGIYAGEGPALIKWDAAGNSRQVMEIAPWFITEIATAGDVLFRQGGGLATLNKHTGMPLATPTSSNGSDGGSASYDVHSNRIFMRSSSLPGRIFYLELGPDGRTISSADSPYSQSVQPAARTFTFPAGKRVVEDSGTIYHTEDLTYANSLGAAFTDMTFHGVDVPIVLRGNRLTAYTNSFRETGSFTLNSAEGKRVAVHGTDALVFVSDASSANGFRVQTVALTSMQTPVPGQPVNPVGLSYSVDDAFLDRDGVLNIYSRNQLSLFRWSPAQQTYQAPVALSGAPVHVAYLAGNHTFYSAYSSQKILKMDLGAALPSEVPFFNSDSPLRGMVSGDNFLFGTGSEGALILSLSGNVLSNSGGTAVTQAPWMTWDPVRRRIYRFHQFIQTYLRYDNISTGGAGTFGAESQLTGLVEAGPIRVRPDGRIIAVGGGAVFEADNLTRITTLAASMVDLAWQEDLLISIEALGTSATTVQRWSNAWTRQDSVTLGGTPLRLFRLSGNRLLVMTKHSTGEPRFHILERDLAPVFDSVPTPPAIVQQPASVRTAFGGQAALTVQATGSPPLAYQWYRNNTLIPGATGPGLNFSTAGSALAGTYHVLITNGAGTLKSGNATFVVGPVPVPAFAAGNLLVANGSRIHEYSPAGVAVKTLTVPAPALPSLPGTGAGPGKDLEVDSLGRVHFINVARVNFLYQYYLSSYDPGIVQWQHTLIPDPAPSPFEREALLNLAGDWALVRGYRIHLQSRQSILLPGGFTPAQIVTGLDAGVYGLDFQAGIQTLSPVDWAWSPKLTLQSLEFPNRFAIAADGRIWAGDSNSFIRNFSATGSLLRSLPLTGATQPRDLSLSASGQIALGQTNAGFLLTNTELLSARRVALPGTSTDSTYTTWMPAIVQPVPSFVVQVPPPAVENAPWSWRPEVAHPDRDAVLTITSANLPSWLNLATGQLSGTPRAAHTGSQTLTLTVRDGNGRTATQTFTVQVEPSNTAPRATNQTLNRLEDAPAEELSLASIFSDQETAASALNYNIISQTGPVSVTLGQPPGSTLRISYPTDASGTAAITVRAADPEGLFAEAVITIHVAPVNDLPAGSIPPLALDEDAAAIGLNLDDAFSDIETADSGLAFAVTSSQPALATAQLAGHTLTVTPQPNAFGELSITVSCQDPDGGSVEVPFRVTLRPVNDFPTGRLADLLLEEDFLPAVIDLAAAFEDIETPDAALRFIATSSQPATGQAAVAGSLLTLTSQQDANGSFTVMVTCSDPDGGVKDVRFDVTVRPVNDPPVIPAALPAVSAGDAAADAVIDFTPFASDPDRGDPLTWRILSNSNPGLFTRITFDAQGRLHLQYAPYVSGQATVMAEVSDAAGTRAQRSFTVDLPPLPLPVLETSGPLTLNRQTGLWEQKVIVRNPGQRAIGGFEIAVTGLPAGSSLYNASGSTENQFTAASHEPLGAGARLNMILEYYVPNRAVPQPRLQTALLLPSAPQATSAGGVLIERLLMVEPGAILLEFRAVPGQLYQVQYDSGNGWTDSLVRIRAAGNRVQWIDRGAPRTHSPPGMGKSRFYRVKQLTPP
jgi:hypothetical protein